MRSRIFLWWLTPVAAVAFLTAPGWGQTWGKIVGHVRDAQSGEPLPGANVTIEGTTMGAATDQDGYYLILRVPPGRYTLRASFIGYQTVVQQEVQVLTDLTTTVDFQLQPTAIEGEQVVIVAERPLVRRDLTASEARVQAEEIDALPVQNVTDVLVLQAGVIRDTGGGFHIRGGRSSEIAYMVNGISITDDYYRTQALVVENESIRELQVVSGAFNAEYGNAMSGVINVVTKDGGNEFSAKVEAYSGDYLTTHKDIFWHIDHINPFSDYSVQAVVSGPIVRDKLTYFFTGRRLSYEGWLYGPYVYSPQGRLRIVGGDTVLVRGDSSAVPMNPQDRWSAQGAIKWRIGPTLSLKTDFLGSRYKANYYNHSYRLNPYGRRNYYGYGATVINKLTHVLSSRTFYELTLSLKKNEDKSYLYEDPYDPRYVHPDSLTAGSFKFFKAGTDLYRSARTTQTAIAKLDFTSQVNPQHLVKLGVEAQRDWIDFEDLTLVPATDASGRQIVPFRPAIEPTSTPNHSKFRRTPERYAAYIQDKIEYKDVVINVGLRFDYFHSNGQVPADPQDPNVYKPLRLNHIYRDRNGNGTIDLAEQTDENRYSLEERKRFWYRRARPKWQLSPRFGIAYPITDRGVIHFSYGIFQQIPDYSQLYAGDEIKLTEGQGIAGPFGNPDLNPQRTTMYELGLRQQLTDDIAIDVTGYYRDIRDWVSTSPPIPTYAAGVTYTKRINRDFANVHGLTLSLMQRFSRNLVFNLNYTYQRAEGTNSSPEDEYFALTQGAEPKKQLAPLDWDQRHTLNANLYYGRENWGMSAVCRYWSGQPYTPEILAGTLTGQNVIAGLATNTRRRPTRFTTDLYAFRRVKLRGLDFELFLEVYNLFDAKNPVGVWADSGKPDFTLRQRQQVEADPGWFVRPDFYSEPRKVHLGVRVSTAGKR
ncbi:MAG: TonB-dependent receptor [candidate division KSB1 bacterium]|nr:TonB-dependent receptor [candidate division KSB1 bacterium]